MNNILYYNVVRVIWFGFRCRWDRESLSMEAKFLSFWPRTLFRNRAFRPDQALQPRSFSFPLSQNGTRLTRIATYVGSLVALVIVEIYGVVLMWLRVYRYRTVLIYICFRWHFLNLRLGRFYISQADDDIPIPFARCIIRKSLSANSNEAYRLCIRHSAFNIRSKRTSWWLFGIHKTKVLVLWKDALFMLNSDWGFLFCLCCWLIVGDVLNILCGQYTRASEQARTRTQVLYDTQKYLVVPFLPFYASFLFLRERPFLPFSFTYLLYGIIEQTYSSKRATSKLASNRSSKNASRAKARRWMVGGCMLHPILLNFILTSHSTSVRSRRNNTLLFTLYLFDIHTIQSHSITFDSNNVIR